MNTASFQNVDNKTIGDSKIGEIIKFNNSKVQNDFHQDDPALRVNNENSAGKFEFYFEHQGDNAAFLSFIGLKDGAIRFRFDSIRLSKLAQ
ncbi:hypothetical protein AJ87_26855 [Rhizobium yanglingense]|nr:hypothetical protein AJ87_26855 [Rhizobium yanglingense]